MERKYQNQKKSIIVLCIACVLLIGLIIYFQVRIQNVKAEEVQTYEAKVAELTAQLDEMQAAYDAKDYKGTISTMKDEIKTLKAQKEELLATPAPTAEPTPVPTAEPTVAPTVKPTVTPTVKPTVAPTVKPTVAPTAEPTATAATQG